MKTLTIVATVLAAAVLAACGGGGDNDEPTAAADAVAAPAPVTTVIVTAERTVAAEPTAEEAEPVPEPEPTTTEEEVVLALSSLCGEFTTADAAIQREFAEAYRSPEEDVTEALDRFSSACTAKRKALQITEALDKVADAQAQAELDALLAEAEANATRIDGKFAGGVAKDIKKSWNRCNERDVCIPGETALSVGCAQPDKQVAKLRCFVTTERIGDEQYGYTVAVDVNMDNGSYTWRIAQND